MLPKLKITAIKPYPVWVGTRNQLVVNVETDQGVYGWGESGLSSREKAVVGAIEHYREFIIGQDAMQIGRIWQEMYRSQYFEGGRVLQAAISAIDIALHDIKSKALGVPVYELLGGKQRDLIPTFATTSSGRSPYTRRPARNCGSGLSRCMPITATERSYTRSDTAGSSTERITSPSGWRMTAHNWACMTVLMMCVRRCRHVRSKRSTPNDPRPSSSPSDFA